MGMKGRDFEEERAEGRVEGRMKMLGGG